MKALQNQIQKDSNHSLWCMIQDLREIQDTGERIQEMIQDIRESQETSQDQGTLNHSQSFSSFSSFFTTEIIHKSIQDKTLMIQETSLIQDQGAHSHLLSSFSACASHWGPYQTYYAKNPRD